MKLPPTAGTMGTQDLIVAKIAILKVMKFAYLENAQFYLEPLAT